MSERRRRRSTGELLRPLVPLAVLWLAACVLLGLLILQRRVPYEELVLDPNYSSGLAWYVGFVSNLGVLAWTTAAVSGLVGAWVARFGGRPKASSMLLGGSVLTLLLLFDDLFQLHALIKPLLGLPKAVAYLIYLMVAGTWVLTQAGEILRTRYGLLLAGGAALGLSIVIDQGADRVGLTSDVALIGEDAAKFLGILAWAQYFTLTTIDIVRSILIQLTDQIAVAERRLGDLNRRLDSTGEHTVAATVRPTTPGRSGDGPTAAVRRPASTRPGG